MQSVLALLLVTICAVYATWTLLLPSPLRARLATAALRLPWPEALRASVQRQAAASGNCGCAGCDKAPRAVRGNEQPVQFVRRSGR